jgi:predicted lipoprotein with Yx(FWY)xxD motif
MSEHLQSRGKRMAMTSLILIVVALLVLTYIKVDRDTPSTKKFDVVVKIHDTDRFGKILVTQGGRTLYTYKLDTIDHSNCATFCLQVWPPLVVQNGVVPRGSGVSGLGAITRADGQRQVTYQGMPLYTYVLDHAPGSIEGDSGWWSIVPLHTTGEKTASDTAAA